MKPDEPCGKLEILCKLVTKALSKVEALSVNGQVSDLGSMAMAIKVGIGIHNLTLADSDKVTIDYVGVDFTAGKGGLAVGGTTTLSVALGTTTVQFKGVLKP